MGKIGSDEWFDYYIRSQDHNPPHFHVQAKDGNYWGKFSYKNFQQLDGNLKYGKRRIKKFLRNNYKKIDKEWKKCNPDI